MKTESAKETKPFTYVKGYSTSELKEIYEKMEAASEQARCMNMCDFANWPRTRWREMYELMTGRRYKYH